MSEPEIDVVAIPSDEDPSLKLKFGDSSVTITLSFEGDWLELFGDKGEGLSEGEARHGFAAELFNRVVDMLK